MLKILKKRYLHPLKSQNKFSESLGHKQQANHQYDPDRHTILKNIFTYRYNGNYLGYIIRDEPTNSLISIDPGDFEIGFRNIQLLELEFKATLKYILCTHHHEAHTASVSQLKKRYPDLEIIIGYQAIMGRKRHISRSQLKRSSPFKLEIYQFVYFILQDIQMIAVHSSFTMQLLNLQKLQLLLLVILCIQGKELGCHIKMNRSCGKVHTNDYGMMLGSLNKLKTLPNETLIFPGHDNGLHNLTWIKTLDPKNPLLKFKIVAFERFTKENGFCVPSILNDERKYNPFLRCSDKYYSDLIEETDPVKIFTKIKKAQELMFKL